MAFISNILKAIAGLGTSGNVGCLHLWLDEPQMPKSLIEK
jgi:cyclic lactone autoinducer peptide